MKRLTAWLAGVLGGAAAYRALRRRPAQAPVEPDPADELKAKLAEARAAADHQADDEGDATVDEVADVDARRQSVHEQARAAIDEMKRD